jgi:hypothetical protein
LPFEKSFGARTKREPVTIGTLTKKMFSVQNKNTLKHFLESEIEVVWSSLFTNLSVSYVSCLMLLFAVDRVKNKEDESQ